MPNPDLLSILICPRCKGALSSAGTAEKPLLACHACNLGYPIENDIPIMLGDRARPLKEAAEGQTVNEGEGE